MLQLAAHIAIYQRIDDKAGTFGDFAQYPVEMADRPNHRPVMLDRLDILKLREARLGDRLQRFAGRIRHEVDMKPDHELTCRHLRNTIRIALTDSRGRHKAGASPRGLRTRPGHSHTWARENEGARQS